MYLILQNFQEYKIENKMFHFPFQVCKEKQKISPFLSSFSSTYIKVISKFKQFEYTI
jgi:hypothetical protein